MVPRNIPEWSRSFDIKVCFFCYMLRGLFPEEGLLPQKSSLRWSPSQSGTKALF